MLPYPERIPSGCTSIIARTYIFVNTFYAYFVILAKKWRGFQEIGLVRGAGKRHTPVLG